LQNVANSFMGYYPKFTINKRKLTFKEQEPYFIYVTGHGGDTYFKIR
jgi:glycosylphosphatidylinositol transamidase (GPIT) subunit GPI8